MEKVAYDIYQSRYRRQKENNPGIGIKFNFIEAAENLGTITKYGAADETGGVRINRMVQRSTNIETVDSAVKSDLTGDS